MGPLLWSLLQLPLPMLDMVTLPDTDMLLDMVITLMLPDTVMLDTDILTGMQELTLLPILPTLHMLGMLDMAMLPTLLPLLMLLPTKLSNFILSNHLELSNYQNLISQSYFQMCEEHSR